VDGYLEIAAFTTDFFNAGTGMDFNVDIPADLDQFGGDNSHGTIISGKGFV